MTATIINQELVTIASFVDYIQANIAKTKVESVGIECWLADDVIVTLNWLYSQAVGGVKIKVREADAEKAHAALRDTTPTVLPDRMRRPPKGQKRLLFERIPRRLIFQIWAASYVVPVLFQLAYYIMMGVQGASGSK